MASFLDQQYKFAPYVETTPVEAMVKVGMLKQQQYDEGVQKINSWIDETAALPVMRDVDKQYLQSSLNSLTSNLKKVAGADFSNQQLVSSVGGATKRISRDPIIRAAVYSTANHQNELELLEADRKAGKLSPANEDDYYTKFQSYYGSKDLKDQFGNPIQFSGKYTTRYDWQEDLRKEIAAAHIDEREWEQEAYTTDAKGNKVINPDVLYQKMEKGLLTPKVKGIVSTVFSRPQVAQQLGIEARFQYKGYTPEAMIALQENSYNYLKDQTEKRKEALLATAGVSSKDAAKNAIEAEALDKELKTYRENADQFINKIKTDFEGAKYEAYVNDQKARMVSDYSWSAISSKMVKSPAAEMALSRANYDLAVKKEIFDEWAKRQDLKNDEARLAIDVETARIARLKAVGQLTAEGTPSINYSTGAIDPNEEATKGSVTYNSKTKDLEVQRQQMQAQLISSLPGGYADMYVNDKGIYRINWDKFSQPRYREALKALNLAHLNGTIRPELKNMESDFYDLTSVVMERNTRAKEIESTYAPAIKALATNLKTGMFFLKDLPEEIPVVTGARRTEGFPSGGDVKTINLKKEDIAQVYIAKQSPLFGKDSPEIISAKNYLQNKYGLTDKQLSDLLYDAASPITSSLNRLERTVGPEFASQMQRREQAYKNLQETSKYQHGLINTAKTEDRDRVNALFSREISEALGDKAKTGDYASTISWLDASKEGNLKNNQYYVYRRPTGGWELQIRRNEGSAFKFSPPIQVSEQTALDLGAKVDLNKDQFMNTFGNFLEINNWSKTARDLSSQQANSSALLRHKVGKYSVGLHLKSFGEGSWLPFAYINDENGNPVASGVQIDMTAFKNAKDLSAEERERIAQMPLVWKDADVVKQFMNLPESYFDLLLNN